MALDVDLADRVDQRVAGRRDGAALARALLLLAGEDAAVEGEAQIVIGLRQHRGDAAGGVEGEPVLPDVERLAARPGRRCRASAPACQAMIRPGRRAAAASKKASQSMPGARVANSARARSATRVRVLRGDRLGMGAGDLGFEIEDAAGAGLGVGHAHQGQHLADIGAVGRRGPGPSPARRRDNNRGPAGRGRPGADRRMLRFGSCRPWATKTPNRFSVPKLVAFSGSTSARMLAPSAAESSRRSGDGVDPGEHGLQRRGAARVDRGAVEIGGVIIGDPALVAAGGGIVAAGAGDDLDVAPLDQQGGGEEGADRGAVGRDLGVRCASRHWHNDRSRRRARRPCRCRRRRRRRRRLGGGLGDGGGGDEQGGGGEEHETGHGIVRSCGGRIGRPLEARAAPRLAHSTEAPLPIDRRRG